MWRLVLSAAAAIIAAGLQVTDFPLPEAPVEEKESQSQLITSGTVSALDPELTNTAGEMFHVTVVGEWNLISLPKATGAELSINVTLENLSDDRCGDLLIRKVEITGTKLGDNISALDFYVAKDTFNDTAAIGLTLSTPSGTADYDPMTFLQGVPQCTIVRPRAEVKLPTARSYRKRTRIYTAKCTFGGTPGIPKNVITMHYSTVWRGYNKTEAVSPWPAYYLNDLEVYVSGVGSDPGGLLGPDDHTDATVLVSGCPKKQPVNGPYQTRIKHQSS